MPLHKQRTVVPLCRLSCRWYRTSYNILQNNLTVFYRIFMIMIKIRYANSYLFRKSFNPILFETPCVVFKKIVISKPRKQDENRQNTIMGFVQKVWWFFLFRKASFWIPKLWMYLNFNLPPKQKVSSYGFFFLISEPKSC